MQKPKFCGMCCSYHVGANLREEFQNCSVNCESIILGDKVKSKSDNKGASSKKSTKGAVPARKGKGAARKSGKSKKKTSTTKQMKKFFKDV
jgi:hypothetical protein